MVNGSISRHDVLKTLEEFDALGRETFLSTYGYGPARKYVIVHEDREYDSKAIVGVAHKHQHGAPLTHKQLSGGLGHAVDELKRLGFVIRAARNPAWTRDELILACDVVARNEWRGLDAEDPRVAELSNYLQQLGAHPEEERAITYRNRNGAARKTFDIATHHPSYQLKPTNGGRLDREVLHDFLDRPAEMAQAARLIREGLKDGTLDLVPLGTDDAVDDEVSAPEGRVLYRRHRTRERNRKLRQKKIRSVLKAGGALVCEACGFDFAAVYGERGEGYIECHHVVPLHEAGESTTKLSDLALICANCHRMIHRSAPWPTPAELRELIERQLGRLGSSVPLPRSSASVTTGR
ncbi:HNH endonuclease [Streptomyces oryzae]|uniref:HNH endonuclease n=1 Tax=Streptomyces oryzae TaxID=1434886 RepID=A0ABS3XLM4_9ACTN|nr:HNH endonuclease [Streptomyces oryzae]MBO8196210.1 HNH endonuclease [Streptomyces oryzae]